MKFLELDNSLRQGIAPFYIVSGEDAYCRLSALKKIEGVVNPAFAEFNITEAEGSAQSIVADCNAFPFMSEKRIVQVKEFYPIKKEKEILLEYASNPFESTCLIIINERNSELDKAQGVTFVDCSFLDINTIVKWITVTCRMQGKSITSENAALIAEYCLNDMSRINLEVEKLICYCDSVIEKRDIEAIVTKDSSFRVYQLTDRISAHDPKGASNVLEELLASGEEPTALLALIYSSFRRMFYAVNNDLDSMQLAKALGVKPNAISYAKSDGLRFGAVKLRKLLNMCIEADYDIKNSFCDKTERLKLLVLQASI